MCAFMPVLKKKQTVFWEDREKQKYCFNHAFTYVILLLATVF